MNGRWIDDVRNRLLERGLEPARSGCERPIFGDLIRSDEESLDQLLPEPALVLETERRIFAVHRLGEAIRYYAGPNARHPEAAAGGPGELGLLPSIDEAVELAVLYLEGESLDSILVPREVVAPR